MSAKRRASSVCSEVSSKSDDDIQFYDARSGSVGSATEEKDSAEDFIMSKLSSSGDDRSEGSYGVSASHSGYGSQSESVASATGGSSGTSSPRIMANRNRSHSSEFLSMSGGQRQRGRSSISTLSDTSNGDDGKSMSEGGESFGAPSSMNEHRDASTTKQSFTESLGREGLSSDKASPTQSTHTFTEDFSVFHVLFGLKMNATDTESAKVLMAREQASSASLNSSGSPKGSRNTSRVENLKKIKVSTRGTGFHVHRYIE